MMSLLVFADLLLSLPAALDAVDSVIHLVMALRLLVNQSLLVPLQAIVPTRPLLIPFLAVALLFLKTCATKLLMRNVNSLSVIFKLDHANPLVDVPNLETVKSQTASMHNVSFPTSLVNQPLEPVMRLFAKVINGEINQMKLNALPQVLTTNVSLPSVMLTEIALSPPFLILNPLVQFSTTLVILVYAILLWDGLTNLLFALPPVVVLLLPVKTEIV